MSIRAFTLVIFVASLCLSIVAAGVEDHATAIREVLKKAWSERGDLSHSRGVPSGGWSA